ncbi:MAG TPA: hypothetical protein VIE46_02775 [Gemmatimonadales bacterium]|jgi:hypothetical protein
MPRFLALTLALTLSPVAARAQLAIDVHGGIGFVSQYVDRGVILSSEPVLQPRLDIGLPVGGGSFGISVLATVQPLSLDSTRYFGMTSGKTPSLTEARPAISLSQRFGPMRFSWGAEGRLYLAKTGITKSANTVSFVTSLGAPDVPFAPKLTFAYDAGGITGPYFEGELRQVARIAKGVAFTVGGRAGYAVDQTADTTVAAFAPYTRTGFTHLDLTAGALLTVAGAMVSPYITYTCVPNPLVPAVGPARQLDHVLWVGMTLAVGGRFPKPPKPAQPAQPIAK